MLIFERFPSMERAGEFALYCTLAFGREAIVCRDQEESQTIDPFPYVLEGPLVLVERENIDYDNPLAVQADLAREKEIAASVVKFHGQFAGT
jgi:hypothetical protein